MFKKTWARGLVIVSLMGLAPSAWAVSDETIFTALQAVETGGCARPAEAVGDGGRARGWYQMHYAFYCDAYEQLVREHKLTGKPTVDGWKLTCYNKKQSELYIRAYWRRYKCVTLASKIHRFNPRPEYRVKFDRALANVLKH